MGRTLTNGLIILLLFVITLSGLLFAILLGEGLWGVPKGVGVLTAYLFLFGVTAIGLEKLKGRIGLYGVLVPILLAVLLLLFPKAYNSTIKFTIKISPFILAIILGVLSGFFYHKSTRKKFLMPLLFGLFPLIMSFGVYDLWIHRIEYGNWTGEVTANRVAPFEMHTKLGETVSNGTLEGKIVLFDFWYITCGPCWVKFPDLQRIHEKYSANPSVEIYAVNRPMPRDKPGALFQRIEEREYTFPVLRGTQEVMDLLGVYKYPSVMILNQEGDMVFMGELEDAEEKLASMLE